MSRYLLSQSKFARCYQRSLNNARHASCVILAIAIILSGLSVLSAAPVAAQESALGTSTGSRIDTNGPRGFILPPFVFASPPLPLTEPRLGPSVVELAAESAAEPQPQSETSDELAGWIGYGYGSSPIGSGLDILSNPDDMDLRSTSIDLSLIQSSDSFVMPSVTSGERWIRVDLGNQQVVAYEGQYPQRAFIVSTGLPNSQTVTGEFRIRMKVSEQTMSGDDFYLPGVKWVQYFYSEYAFHGTYWHSDFGIPKSHGCVNMTNADAKWLFDWAGPTWDEETVWFRSTEENPGTLVNVHK